MKQELWLTPLLLLPGVGLLVMSTSARFGQIHAEIHHLLDHGKPDLFTHLCQRSRLFRNALVSLYLSVAFFSLASLCGGILNFLNYPQVWVVMPLTGFGIFCVLFAAFELIRESILSLRIIEEHGKDIARRGRPNDA